MDVLRRAVDGVLAQDPHELADDELAERLACLEGEMARLAAAQLATLAVFDARKVFVQTRHANAASWLRDQCRLAPGDATSRVRMARRLRDELDDTAKALSSGEVTFAQARVICEQAGRVADRLGEQGTVALKHAEPIFLEAARTLHPQDLGKVVKRWEQVVDHDGFLSDAERAHHARFLNLSQSLGGMWRIDGLLDPEAGATLAAAIRPLATPAGREDSRTPAQRRADALVDVGRRVLDAGTLPASGGEKPHLIVEITLDSLERRLGTPPGELAGGGPIPAETARRLACDAPRGAGITAARQRREQRSRRRRRPARKPGGPRRGASAKRPFRRAPRRRAAWFPGRAWTDGHHIDHWVDHLGPTNMDNVVLLCRRHHRAVHEGGQVVERPPPRTALQL